MSASFHPDTGRPPAGPHLDGLELPKPRQKELSSLGHRVARLAQACASLAGSSHLPAELAPWLRSMPPLSDPRPVGDGIFGCPVSWDQDRITVRHLFADHPAAETALAALRSARPDLVAGPGALAVVAPWSTDPLWLALLRLRPLREFWERQLRRSTLESLFASLPDAWLLDPTPLPPGSVIPRLELASWAEFDPLLFPDLEFIPDAVGEVSAALSAHPAHPRVLLAHRRQSADAASFVSLYRMKDDRVDWLGVAA